MSNVYCENWKLNRKDLNIFYYRRCKEKKDYCIKVIPIFKYSFLFGPTEIFEWQVKYELRNKIFSDSLKAIMWSDLFLFKTKKHIPKYIFNPSCILSDEEILKIAKENFKKIGEKNDRN